MPSWETLARGLAIVLAVMVFAWGAWGLVEDGPVEPSVAVAQASGTALGDALPRAWEVPSATPSMMPSATSTTAPTQTPTRYCTATPMPSATLTGTPPPTDTPSPTRTLSPTQTRWPTATPIHAPAGADPTRIVIPAISLDAAVVTVGIVEKVENGVTTRLWEVADYAAGFHGGMARPGHIGNTVISGHNNIRGEVFKDIDKLQPGDDIYLWVGTNVYRYVVNAQYRLAVTGAPPEVQQENLKWIMDKGDQRLTLVTCWPYWSNTHRTIIVAFPAAWD